MNHRNSFRTLLIYSQGIYFESGAGGEVMFLWFYNNKQKNKKKKKYGGETITARHLCEFLM